MVRGNTRLEERTFGADSGGERRETHVVYPDGSSLKVTRAHGQRIIEAIGQEDLF